MSADGLISLLGGVKRMGDGRWLARCPAHDDGRASLSIRELDDGRTLVHCFAGCDIEDILGALGLQFDSLFPPRPVGHAARERRPFPASDVLQAVSEELAVITVIVSDIKQGKQVNRAGYDRLALAIERVQAAQAVAIGQ